MRLSDAALADQHHGPVLMRSNRLQRLDQVVARVGNVEKFRSWNLGRAGLVARRQLNRGASQRRTAKFGSRSDSWRRQANTPTADYRRVNASQIVLGH